MSIRAYLINEDIKVIDGKRYVHEEEEYLWNNWGESEIWDVLWSYMRDFTNDDCCGFIEIWQDEWNKLKNDYNTKEKLHKVVNEHKDVFMKIDSMFKMGDEYVKINLY